MDAWGEDLAIFTPKSMHEAKMLPGRGLLRAFGGEGDAYGAILASWALGPPQCKEGMRGFMGRRGGVAALAGAAGGGAGGRGSGGCCGAGARRWWVLRAGALTGAALRGGAAMVTALELTAQQARWKRVTVGREESGLARRNTPARVAAIRPNWRALPQRALRALR